MNPPTVTAEWLCAYCDTPNPSGRTNCERCHTIWSWRPKSEASGDDAVAYVPPVAEPARGPAWTPALVVIPLVVVVAVLGYFVTQGSLFGTTPEQASSAPAVTDQEIADDAVRTFEAQVRELGFVPEAESGEEDAESLEQEIAACEGVPEVGSGGGTETGYAESATYELGQLMPGQSVAEFVSASVTFGSTPESLAELDRDAFGTCLGGWFAQGMMDEASADGEAVTLDGPHVTAAASPVGDSGITVDVLGAMELQGIRIPFRFVFDIIQQGRAVVMLTTGWVGDGTGTADRGLLLNRLLNGLTAA